MINVIVCLSDLILKLKPLAVDSKIFHLYLLSIYSYINVHEYAAPLTLVYHECIDCKKRTPHICIECNYCYSCHPNIERIEKEEERDEKQRKKVMKILGI